MTTQMVCNLIDKYSSAITCFCFMGGDAEPQEIEKLASMIKTEYPHLKTGWYSGKDHIPEGFRIEVLDFIKTGPYMEALGGLKSPETNQRLYKVMPDLSLVRIYINK